MTPTRVLIVDDSPTMRRLIRTGIEADPAIQVVAEAGNAREARDAVKALAPEVMTLDVDMPGMNGLEFLARLMRARPMPVVMVSSLTARGSEATVRALSLGALDYVEKPRFGNTSKTFGELVEKIHVAAEARISRHTYRQPSPALPPTSHGAWNGKWLLIGSSTGGVEAIETVLSRFSERCPPTLIAQHMPAHFLKRFAARLDTTVAPRVQLARDGARPSIGEVHLAPGGETHLRLDRDGETLVLWPGPKRSGHRPSVDELFLSAAPHGAKMIAAILTGMGHDGAEGMCELRKAGALCVGQDQGSSVVYGMPRVANERGGVAHQLPLQDIAPFVIDAASKRSGEHTQ